MCLHFKRQILQVKEIALYVIERQIDEDTFLLLKIILFLNAIAERMDGYRQTKSRNYF